MTHDTTTPALPPVAPSFPAALRARLDAVFASIGQGFNAYIEIRSRRDQIEALYRLSDEELEKLGTTRDRIPHYVFRDRYCF